MKKTSRVIGMFMCVALAVGCITGCGGQSDEDILMESVGQINEAKSYSVESALSGKMVLGMKDSDNVDQTQEMDMNINVQQTVFTEPVKAKAVTRSTVMGQTTSTETYMQKEDDKYVTYTGVGGVWQKLTLGDLDAVMENIGIDMGQQFAEDAARYVKKEDQTEGDKTYMIYDYKLEAEEVKEILESMGSSLVDVLAVGNADEVMDKLTESIGDMNYSLWIDKEEKTLARVECPMKDLMQDLMQKIMDAMFEEMANSAKDSDNSEESMGLTEALSQMSINVEDMTMVMNYKDMNAAADFEIPQEALDAPEMSTDTDK